MINKIITSLALFSFFVLQVHGQQLNKHEMMRDQVIVDVHYNSFYHINSDFKDVPYKSVGYSFNWFKSIPFNPSVSMGIGIGYTINKSHSNYHFVPSHEIGHEKIRLFTSFREKNKLVTEYLEVPIELRFHTPLKNGFHWYMGVRPGIAINHFIKYRTEGFKSKIYNTTPIEIFKLEPTLRFGYGKINLFAAYNLLPTFQHSALKDIHQFSIGLSYFSGFER